MTRDAAPTPDEIVRSMPDASAEDLVEMAAEWGVTMTSEDVERLRQEQRARLFTASAAPPAAYDLDDDAPVDDGDGGDDDDSDGETLAAAGDEDGEGDDDAAPVLAEGAAAEDAPANAVARVPDPGRRRRILVPTRASAAEPAPVKRRPGRPRKDGNGAPPTRAPAPAASDGTGAEEHAFRQAAIALVLTSGGKRARAILDDVLAKIRDAGRLRAGLHAWALTAVRGKARTTRRRAGSSCGRGSSRCTGGTRTRPSHPPRSGRSCATPTRAHAGPPTWVRPRRPPGRTT